MKSERMLKLMAYADGELSGAELEEVEGWLKTDPDAVRFANEISGLGELVVAGYPKAKPFDIADAVMAKIDEPAPAAKVVPIGAAKKKTSPAVYVAAALALAASVFFIAKNKPAEQPMAAPQTQAPAATTVAVNTPPAPAPENADNPEVEVESPGSSVSVFYLPNESTLTTSVMMWVDDTGGK